MPQMYPTQWIMLTNLIMMMFILMISLLKESHLENTTNKSKLFKSKNWKW